ncbi:MAG TPA: GC-type dockerin domain-anchored protein [Phycisphaerales bacterium]|nr:GC-type dockerin domain-anchored protein [Phycisphaerales bacterium]
MRRIAAVPALMITAAASAQPADLVVQPGASSVAAELCLTPPGLSTECDSDSSAVSGGLVIELDSYVSPGAITMHDFTLALSDSMTYTMDWGFFIGGVNIELTDVVVAYATPGTPTGPVAVDGAGAFDFPVVQAIIAGNGSYEGYGPVMGQLVGSGSFNLADFGVVDSAIAGTVAVAGGQVTVSGAQSFANEGEISGVQATIDGDAAIVATGSVPACGADFNGDGSVDTRDVLAFLNAWTQQDPASDCDANGAIDTRDVLCFLNTWTAGC